MFSIRLIFGTVGCGDTVAVAYTVKTVHCIGLLVLAYQLSTGVNRFEW